MGGALKVNEGAVQVPQHAYCLPRPPPPPGAHGSNEKEELLVRDLDMDMVREMRNDWQFYRDRRPDSYQQIARP